jgi:hypothetical protein
MLAPAICVEVCSVPYIGVVGGNNVLFWLSNEILYLDSYEGLGRY